jgi:glycosyltransferase involved in cell wall biosynthesis
MQLQSLFEKHECYVFIPTYNNATAIADVIDSVLNYTDRLLVVNDGSTDNTEGVLAAYPSIHLHSYAKNKGKGYALRQGFKYLAKLGCKYVITLDSDGQHKASDLHAFLDNIEKHPAAIMMGARDMGQASVPGKSSFGNKFSNFWFKLQTGIDMPDTQTGYRLYPLYLIKDIPLLTNKYELEIEVIVKSAWRNIEVVAVPIDVYYPPQEERISHFRPFKDFSRISVLNTWLTTLAIVYFIPKRLLLGLKKKSFKKVLYDAILDTNESLVVKALSVSWGFFIGIAPIWGYQLLIGMPLAHYFKLNKTITFIAANISLPPMIPFIIYGSLKMGELMTGHKLDLLSRPMSSFTLSDISTSLWTYVIGGFSLAVLMAFVGGLISIVVFKGIAKFVNRKSF